MGLVGRGLRPLQGAVLLAPEAELMAMSSGVVRVVKTVQNHGNTSAASIPLALSVAVQDGQIQQGQVVVTEAIGGGLAWGAVVLRW